MGQRAAIYARVSTTDQSCERQIAELTAFAGRSGFEVLGIFKETASGTRNNRLARNRVLQPAQARRIYAVLVTELSRWGHSTQDLLDRLYKLAGWKVSLVAMNGMTVELRKKQTGRMRAVSAWRRNSRPRLGERCLCTVGQQRLENRAHECLPSLLKSRSSSAR